MNLPSRARSPRTTDPSLPSLLLWPETELVHEGLLSEEIDPCGIEKARGFILVVKRHFARNEIAVRADDEWLPIAPALQASAQGSRDMGFE